MEEERGIGSEKGEEVEGCIKMKESVGDFMGFRWFAFHGVLGAGHIFARCTYGFE